MESLVLEDFLTAQEFKLPRCGLKCVFQNHSFQIKSHVIVFLIR